MGSLVQTKTITKLCNPILHFSDWKSMTKVHLKCGGGFLFSPIVNTVKRVIAENALIFPLNIKKMDLKGFQEADALRVRVKPL